MIESLELSDRSRVLLRSIVAVWEATSEGQGCPGEPVTFLRDGRGVHSTWPTDVPAPTRDELTPLRLQGLVSVSAPAGEVLCVAPTAQGREAAAHLVATASPSVLPHPGARRLAERIEALIEAETDADARLRLRTAWLALSPTVARAAEAVIPVRRGPIALAARVRRARPPRV